VLRQASRDRERERAGAAEALAVLASELRAGRMPADALGAAAGVATGALSGTLSAAATGATFGADPGGALLRAAEGSAVPEMLRGLAACWQVCSATGSSLAAAVDRLADALRAERAQRLAVEAELAGPRATAGLLALLPAAGVALAAGLGARPVHVLLHTALGLACLSVGIGLDLLGLWWTGRIVAAAGGDR
jgi:tight adherence protein B